MGWIFLILICNSSYVFRIFWDGNSKSWNDLCLVNIRISQFLPQEVNHCGYCFLILLFKPSFPVIRVWESALGRSIDVKPVGLNSDVIWRYLKWFSMLFSLWVNTLTCCRKYTDHTFHSPLTRSDIGLTFGLTNQRAASLTAHLVGHTQKSIQPIKNAGFVTIFRR